MNSTRRKAFNWFMSRMFGDPRFLSDWFREDILLMVGRWLTQTVPADGRPHGHHMRRLDKGRGHERYQPMPHSDQWAIKNAILAEAAFKVSRIGHWHIDPIALIPKWAPGTNNKGWSHLKGNAYKRVEIAISLDYHRTVAVHDIGLYGRRVVQKVWGERSYKDKTVWNCYFWDFSKLGRDDNSWTKATHHEGYVVKHLGHVVVDESLPRALQVAGKKVVGDSIDSIQSDPDGSTQS